ncbi:MAG: SCO family protein [Blastocatellia bacterium]
MLNTVLLFLPFALPASCAGLTLPQQPGSAPGPHANHQKNSTVAASRKEGNTKILIPDIEVVDQNRNRLHFYRDLIKGRLTAINFIFTSCTYICPLQGAAFSKLQAALGDRLGRDVFLISVTTDPLVDTPERLKAWGERFGAKAGWTFVTGRKSEMDRLLQAIAGDVSGTEEHSPFLLIVDDDQGVRFRAYGLAEPRAIMKYFDDIKNGPGNDTSVKHD